MNEAVRQKTSAVTCAVSGTRYTLYQCPAQCRAIVRFINAAASAASNILVVEFYRASDTTRFDIISGKTLNAGDTFTLQEAYFTLEAGDRIEVTSTSGTLGLDAICTIEEIFRPIG